MNNSPPHPQRPKVGVGVMLVVANSFCLASGFAVPAQGLSAGLAVTWSSVRHPRAAPYARLQRRPVW